MPGALRGPLDGWAGLSGTRLVFAEYPELFEAPISADGELDATLASLPDEIVFPIRRTGCETLVEEGDPDLRLSHVWRYRVLRGQEIVGQVDERLTPVRGTRQGTVVVARVYADRATRFRGYVRCHPQTTMYDLSLVAGWNAVKLTINQYGGGEVLAGTYTNLEPEATSVLLYTAWPPDFFPYIADPAPRVLPGTTVDVPLDLQTVGGLAGDVAVSLEDAQPGLTLVSDVLRVGGGPGRYSLTLRASRDVARVVRPVRFLFRAGTLSRTVSRDVDTRGPFSLSLPPDEVFVRQNGSVSFQATLSVPSGSVFGRYRLSLEPGTTGLTIDEATLDADRSPAVSLTLRAAANAAPGARLVRVFATNASDTVSESAVLRVNVVPAGFDLSPAGPASVYAQEESAFPVTLFPQGGFAGEVSLSLAGLPSGVRQARPVVVSLNGDRTTVNVPVRADAGVEVADVPITVRAASASVATETTVILRVRPSRVRVPAFAGRSGALVVDGANSVFAASRDGLYKVSTAGTVVRVSGEAPLCGSIAFGADGGIWAGGEPFVRYDPVDGALSRYASPRGWSGCAGEGAFVFDVRRRVWVTHSGTLLRLDLTGQRVNAVPGLASSGLSFPMLFGDRVAVVGDGRLYLVDPDSLAVTTVEMPTSPAPGGLVPFGNVFYTTDGRRPGRYDPGTRTVEFHELPNVSECRMLGVDAQGRMWLAVLASTGAAPQWRWVLFDPGTRRVLRDLPELGGAPVVAPNGGLWFADGGGLLYLAP